VLPGRARELETVDRFLRDARGGRSLLVIGDAGIGKTVLLDATRERGGDFLVIATTGGRGRADLPFAALVELAQPRLGHIGSVPAPQASAFPAALALGPNTVKRSIVLPTAGATSSDVFGCGAERIDVQRAGGSRWPRDPARYDGPRPDR
jgi:hypothetical protein